MSPMKITLGLILFLCFAATANGQILLGTDIAVHISIEAENQELKNTFSKDLSKKLSALDQDIVVVGGEGAYLVKVQIMEIKSSTDAEPGYVISTIVTSEEYAATRRNEPEERDRSVSRKQPHSD